MSEEAQQPDAADHEQSLVMRLLVFLWAHSIRPAAICVVGAGYLVFAVFLPTGSMFGIAFIADNFGDVWIWLYVPWLLLLPLLLKPLALLFEIDFE